MTPEGQSDQPDTDQAGATHGLSAPEPLSGSGTGAAMQPMGAPQPLSGQPLPATPVRHHRTIDLNREDDLVPWAEWFHRSAHVMQHVVDPEA